jgi:hypothetical protein
MSDHPPPAADATRARTALRQVAARTIADFVTDAVDALRVVRNMLDELDQAEDQDPMTPPERAAILGSDLIAARVTALTLAIGEIARRTASPARSRRRVPRTSKYSACDHIDGELEKYRVNGLIERWSRLPGAHEAERKWLAVMSNGQTILLSSVHQADLFCCGLESAHQAHRRQDHNTDGQQWAYERGRAGMGPDEFRRQRNIRDKHGAAKLAESLITEGS